MEMSKYISHNYNDYPLLYKYAEQPTVNLGDFRVLEVIHTTCNMSTCDLLDVYAPELVALRLWACISGKSIMPMLQLLHMLYACVCMYVYAHCEL